MTRPSKATEALIETLLVALRTGCTREAACDHAGIVRTTLYRWVESKPGLRARVEKAEADAEVRFTAQVARAAGDDDWRAAAWWLERRRPKSYGRAQAIAAAAAAGAAAPAPAPHPLDDLTSDEVRQRAQDWALVLAADAPHVTGADAFNGGASAL
jgi:hypothetical protein